MVCPSATSRRHISHSQSRWGDEAKVGHFQAICLQPVFSFFFFFLFWLGRFLTIIADVLYCFSIRILCATLTEPPDRKQNEEMPLCVNEGTELASPLIYCPSWLPPAAHSFLLDGPSDSVPCSKPTEPQNHLHNSRGSLHAYQSDTCRGRWQQRQ